VHVIVEKPGRNEDDELEESSVVKQYLTTAADGKSYDTQRYNPAAIVAVGYKVNSERAVRDAVDAEKIKLTSLSGHLSGHFVRISQSIMGTERRPAVAAGDSSRHESRHGVAIPAETSAPCFGRDFHLDANRQSNVLAAQANDFQGIASLNANRRNP